MSCTDSRQPAILNGLNQRRQLALFNSSNSRTESTVSPYTPGITKMQLDMRRKVEILKYGGVTQNTKTNGFTKTEKWANIVSGKSSRRNMSQAAIAVNLSVCASDRLIPTLTSACDVPGPPIYLTYDPTTPLYNYNNVYSPNDDIIPILYENLLWTKTVNDMGIFSVDSIGNFIVPINPRNNGSYSYPEQSLGVIIINDKTKLPASITVPIGIWGRSSSTNTITIAITSITVNMYYNGIPKLITPTAIPTTIIISTTSPSYYDVKYADVLTFNLPATYNTINTNGLPIDNGDIYEFKAIINYTVTGTNTGINTFDVGFFVNLQNNSYTGYTPSSFIQFPNSV